MMSQDRPSASVLPYFEFPQTRYVNDVHLPRFGLPAPVAESGDGTDRPYTEQPPAARCTAGDSKDFSPSNSWNDTTIGSGVSTAAPTQTGARCPTLRAKTQIPRRDCRRGAESVSLMRCTNRQRTFTLFSQSISGARSSSFGQTTVPRSIRARLK